jgi:pyruvate,water dikinase
MSSAVRFIKAVEETRFGGKCVSLGAALRAGLPAPNGYALDVELVDRIAADDAAAIAEVHGLFNEVGPRMAVRSSAVGEDSADASFAGQHLTVLNVMDADAMIAAIKEVHASAHTEEALGYREKMQITGRPAIAVALQTLVASEMAGVMFTRNPMTSESERYIEASWGFGEAIVAGLVVPDTFRLANDGSIIEKTAGEKDLQLVSDPAGNVVEVEVAPEKVESLCLTDAHLAQLHKLASTCESVYGTGVDIEWAISKDQLYLLQCRSITR